MPPERCSILSAVGFNLNPLRAKLVVSMEELDRFEFCGHGVIYLAFLRAIYFFV